MTMPYADGNSPNYARRIEAVRASMETKGVDALLLSVGADLPYFTGYEAPQLERLTMLVLTPGAAVLVVPELEAPRVQVPGEVFELRPWAEVEDPVAIIAELSGRPDRVALGDRTWSAFALALQRALPSTTFIEAGPVTRGLRMIKDPDEIDLLRLAAQAADRVVTRLSGERLSGRTELEIARVVADLALEEGHERASDPIVAAGPNGASPHHEPTARVLRQGDVVVVDFGGTVGGYHSDTTRTFSVGPPNPEVEAVHSIVLEAQQTAAAAVQPGLPAMEIDRAARAVIDEAGYGEQFIHRTGHGIGLEVHEHPYLVEGNDLELGPGMVFSIEPGVYLPGRFGVRIEDIVAVTPDGVESLNSSDRRLHLVE